MFNKKEKKTFVFLPLLFFLFINSNLFSQNAFDYLRDSIDNVMGFTRLDRYSVGYEYIDAGALWGCYLNPNGSIAITLEFERGIEYQIFSGADEEQRITAVLKDERGNTLDDDDDMGLTMLVFKPNATGLYTFTLTNRSRNDLFISTIVIESRRGASVSNDRLIEALENLLSVSEELFVGGEVSFVDSQWILFGGNIKDGEETSIGNVNLSRGEYALIVAGEDTVREMDLDVIRQTQVNSAVGSSIADKQAFYNNVLAAEFTVSNNNSYYYLKGKNSRSLRGQGFIMGFLCRID